MNKKLGIVLGLLIMTSALTMGCSSNASTSETAPAEETKVEVAVEGELSSDSLAELNETPVLVTSFGQSADVAMLKALFAKVGVEISYDPVITADNLGDTKTLFIAAGASTKGLGAAGIKPEEELDRAAAIIAAAEEKGIKIVAVHLGGSARRGELSDKFVQLAVDKANGMIVVSEGNEDGFFTNVKAEKNIPLAEVDSIAKGVEPLKEMYGIE